MEEELIALVANDTWEEVPCSERITPIGSKWVYIINTKSDGSSDRYEIRLVALEYKQEY